jgi:hypothetical protein
MCTGSSAPDVAQVRAVEWDMEEEEDPVLAYLPTGISKEEA